MYLFLSPNSTSCLLPDLLQWGFTYLNITVPRNPYAVPYMLCIYTVYGMCSIPCVCSYIRILVIGLQNKWPMILMTICCVLMIIANQDYCVSESVSSPERC